MFTDKKYLLIQVKNFFVCPFLFHSFGWYWLMRKIPNVFNGLVSFVSYRVSGILLHSCVLLLR